jgi:hypothetical protein
MDEKPDYYIEEFWLNFKDSMINFYQKKHITRPIRYWSSELNKLQQLKLYDEIQNKIRNYISLYAIDLMKDNNKYNTDILITNIKRWNKIADKYNFEKEDSFYHNIIFLLLDIYKILMYDFNVNVGIIFSQVELFILYQDFSSLIDVAIENKKEGILDKLNKFTNINKYIEQKYSIKLDDHISGKKILRKIYNT